MSNWLRHSNLVSTSGSSILIFDRVCVRYDLLFNNMCAIGECSFQSCCFGMVLISFWPNDSNLKDIFFTMMLFIKIRAKSAFKVKGNVN